VFFNLFAAAEPYISVKITHGTPWHAIIRESNGVGKVESSGFLGTDVPSRFERQKTCGSLAQNPETLTIKQQAKNLFNFTVLDNIIWHFYFTCNQKHFTRWSPTAQKLLLIFYVFTPKDSSVGVETPASCANGHEAFIFFKQNVSGNDDLSINEYTIS